MTLLRLFQSMREASGPALRDLQEAFVDEWFERMRPCANYAEVCEALLETKRALEVAGSLGRILDCDGESVHVISLTLEKGVSVMLTAHWHEERGTFLAADFCVRETRTQLLRSCPSRPE